VTANAPRLLFQAHSRRGLGHLARGLNLADAVRGLAPDAAIAFHVSNRGAASCCPAAYRCLVSSGVPDATPWTDAVRTIRPDITIFDTVLRAEDVAATASRRAFVFRKQHETRHADVLSSGVLEHIDLVIVPHAEEEFDSPLPAQVRARTAFVGPIVRLPSAEKAGMLRGKYGIADGDFVMASTAGGGGFVDTASRLFETVWNAHAWLAPVVPRFRHIVVLGPQCTQAMAPLPGMIVVQSEPELVNLLAISSLVVAEGGYNTVNEVRAVKTPAVFIPGSRSYDDQEARVRTLERLGLARVLTGQPAGMACELAAIATSTDALDAMRRAYAADQLAPGNRAAAERLLDLVR
jgi:predicted glycosyltransferase